MELKIDLSKNGKSVFKIVLGILFLAISFAWLLFVDMMNNRMIRSFYWVFFTWLVLYGVMHILKGFGLSIGKAFILINKEIISVKTDFLSKEQRIAWNDVKSIEYKYNSVEILKLNGTLVPLKLRGVEYLLIKEIKQVISEIAEAKGIMIK
jgi:hypothetical protein